MALINCPECNQEISDKAKTCPRCGHPITKRTNWLKAIFDKLHVNKKIAVLSSLMCILIVSLFCFNKFYLPHDLKLAVEACETLKDTLIDRNSLEVYSILVSFEKAENSRINYVKRVYFDYGAKNSYGGIVPDKMLYIIDENGMKYFADKDSEEPKIIYFKLAEGEITGINGLIEPYGGWTKLNDSQIEKVLKRCK